MTAKVAKNSRTKLGCLQNLYIGTFNVRTFRDDGRLAELLLELENIKWNIMGLCQIQWKGKRLLDIKHGHQLYCHATSDGRNSDVSFIMNRELKNNIINFNSLSDGVASLVVKLSKRHTLQIIQAYPPTCSHTDEVDEFYEMVTQQLNEDNHHFKIVMDDLNAKIGERQQQETIVGPCGFGTRNKRGSRLVEFAGKEHLSVINTYFKKKTLSEMDLEKPKGCDQRNRLHSIKH